MRSGSAAAIQRPTLPLAARALFALVERITRGRLAVVGPDGSVTRFGGAGDGPHAELRLGDWQTCAHILRAGDIGLAEAYMSGRCDTPDLAALLELAARNHEAIATASYGTLRGVFLHRLMHLLRANTRSGSRRNIEAHYDLGNAFYRAWLDPGMTYSSALYEHDPGRTLEEAQAAKYRRIAQVLALAPQCRVLEIGCGWGGFAELAAGQYGCRVTGLTISPSQLEYARERMSRAGLAGNADLRLADYRDVRGRFDRIVSIEMFEAVGERYWPGYFSRLRDCLAPGARALVQTITIADRRFERYRRGTDFIQRYVFPGGMLPSPTRFGQCARAAGLEITGDLAFGPDYARTLEAWAQRFEAALPSVRSLGLDEAFVRRWRFYLAYCRAGFVSGSTDVHQYELTAPA